MAGKKFIFFYSFLVSVIDWNVTLRGFVEGFLPSLALVIFMLLLVPILTLVTKRQVKNKEKKKQCFLYINRALLCILKYCKVLWPNTLLFK